MSHPIKVTSDGYVWCIVTYAAKELFSSGALSIYALHDDESETLIETHEQLQDALDGGTPIGIDVGHLYTLENIKEQLKAKGYHAEALWHTCDVTNKYECTDDEAYELLDKAIDVTIEDVNNEIDYRAEGKYKYKTNEQ
jgi:hypothetical protein